MTTSTPPRTPPSSSSAGSSAGLRTRPVARTARELVSSNGTRSTCRAARSWARSIPSHHPSSTSRAVTTWSGAARSAPRTRVRRDTCTAAGSRSRSTRHSGMANVVSGHGGMTARLTVRYRRPTPLHTELQLHARTERIEGRRITTSATLRARDVVTAEAEGLFVVIGAERSLEYFGERPSIPEPNDPLPPSRRLRLPLGACDPRAHLTTETHRILGVTGVDRRRRSPSRHRRGRTRRSPGPPSRDRRRSCPHPHRAARPWPARRRHRRRARTARPTSTRTMPAPRPLAPSAARGANHSADPAQAFQPSASAAATSRTSRARPPTHTGAPWSRVALHGPHQPVDPLFHRPEAKPEASRSPRGSRSHPHQWSR